MCYADGLFGEAHGVFADAVVGVIKITRGIADERFGGDEFEAKTGADFEGLERVLGLDGRKARKLPRVHYTLSSVKQRERGQIDSCPEVDHAAFRVTGWRQRKKIRPRRCDEPPNF